MNIILQISKTLAKGLLTGLNELKVSATPAFLKYLELLEKIATKGIGGPLVLAVLAYLGYGVTTTSVDILQYWGWTGKFWSWVALLLGKTGGLWTTILTIAGIVSFGYVWLLGVLAAPIGVAIHASSPATRTVPHTPVAVSLGTLASSILTEIRDVRIGITNALQVGVKEYVSQVKLALTFVGLTYFFASMFPGLRAVLLLFILGALILTALREFSHPVASFIRFAVCVALLWCVAGKMFPELNPFINDFSTSPKVVVKKMWDATNVFVPENWTKPAFWLLLCVVAPFMYIAYRAILGWARNAFVPTATVVAGSHLHGATATAQSTSHGGGHGSHGNKFFDSLVIVAIAVFIAGCIFWMYNRWVNWDTLRDIRIDAQAELHRVREARQSSAPAPRASVASATPAGVPPADPLTIPDGLRGLKNPKMYELSLTTNWSEEIPRPVGQSVRTHPPDLLTEMRVNGKTVRDRMPGVHSSIKGTHSFALRVKDGSPVTVVVGVGWETSH